MATLFISIHISLLAALAHQIQPALVDLFYYSEAPSRRYQLDHFVYEEQKELIQAKARRSIAFNVACYVMAAAYIHAFSTQHDTLVANRTAARSQAPPFGCEGNQRGWSDLSIAERISLTIGQSTESTCAKYLDHINASVWPNPLLLNGLVLNGAELAGNALAHFLSPHGIFIQVLLVALSVAISFGVVALIWQFGCDVFGSKKKKKKSKKQQSKLPKLLQLELEPRCLLTDEEGLTPKDMP